MKPLTRTVWILSLVSLFNDMASEMLYPVLPVYLKSIGFSIVLLGVLEGIAEAIAGLSKGYFGSLSDQSAKRIPFVQFGYALSALAKPMLSIANAWAILAARTLDKFGKGIRTGARDAMLSAEATPETKGAVFGFHRAMDTTGAVIGPLLALAWLYYFPGDYLTLFLLTIIPGVLTLLATLFLRERKREPNKTIRPSFFTSISFWKTGSLAYRKVAGGLLFFALFNSSDVFLLLMAKSSGLSDTWVIGMYIFYNLVYAIAAFPFGILADKIGFRKMLILGLSFFCITYSCIGSCEDVLSFGIIFFIYGLFAAATDGISKAWISNLAGKNETATALGAFSGLQSIAMMIASSLFGVLWIWMEPEYAFFVPGIAAALSAIYYIFMREKNPD